MEAVVPDPVTAVATCQQHGLKHRLNMDIDLQSLFKLHVTWCAQLYSLAETTQVPPAPAFGLVLRGRYWSAKIDDICCNPLGLKSTKLLTSEQQTTSSALTYLYTYPFTPLRLEHSSVKGSRSSKTLQRSVLAFGSTYISHLGIKGHYHKRYKTGRVEIYHMLLSGKIK